MVAERAAKYIREQNPDTKIGERTIRKLTSRGFPCLIIDHMTLINLDTFDDDLVEYSKNQAIIRQQEIEKTINPIRRIKV